MELHSGIAALVTGGASGLGLATSRRLVGHGCQVVILDRDAALAEQRAGELGCAWAEVDVLDDDAIAAGVALASRLGELRVLVCCAGTAIGQQRTIDRRGGLHRLGAWQKIVEINLTGTYNAARHFAGAVAELAPTDDGERGCIIMTASCAAFDGQAGQTAYAAAKAGIVGLTIPLARDLQPLGIRVNTIAPGTFDTPLMNPDPETLPEALRGQMQAVQEGLLHDVLFPRRMGSPDEYAHLVEHLVTNGYLNGETVRIDAGLRMRAK